MARDEDAEAVPGAERPGSACGARAPGESGELAVRDDVAARDGAQRLRERLAVRRQVAEVELDVGEVVVGSGEVGAEAGDES